MGNHPPAGAEVAADARQGGRGKRLWVLLALQAPEQAIVISSVFARRLRPEGGRSLWETICLQWGTVCIVRAVGVIQTALERSCAIALLSQMLAKRPYFVKS